MTRNDGLVVSNKGRRRFDASKIFDQEKYEKIDARQYADKSM